MDVPVLADQIAGSLESHCHNPVTGRSRALCANTGLGEGVVVTAITSFSNPFPRPVRDRGARPTN